MVEKRLIKRFLQPTADTILDKIIRKHINEKYRALDDSQKRCFYQKYQMQMGSNWIETKRARYRKGKMKTFLNNLREPFVRKVIHFLNTNKDYNLILDIGTGTGQLCFDLSKILGIKYEFVGIDLLGSSIEKNIEEANKMGISNVRFECADASLWIRDRKINNIMALSVATFHRFTETQLLEFLNLIRRSCDKVAIGICEQALPDFAKSRNSKYIDNLCISHNYPEIFQKTGFKIKNIEVKRVLRRLLHVYCIAYKE